MRRKIITINKERCNGCGICASACHEGAIGIVDGKAELLSDHYCDGLGDCLPSCPVGAITFEEREAVAYDEAAVKERLREMGVDEPDHGPESQLRQWPVQIKLIPTKAPCYKNCNLLIAADCTAFTYGNFHNHFIKNHVTLIGCPKLDAVDYSEKLTEILMNNEIRTITILRMEVPCCRGMEMAVLKAMEQCGKKLPWRVVVVSTEGKLLLDSH